jgi:hypothetical protein
VARLLGDQGEDEQPERAVVEGPGAAVPAAMMAVVTVVVVPPVTAIRHVIGPGEATAEAVSVVVSHGSRYRSRYN